MELLNNDGDCNTGDLSSELLNVKYNRIKNDLNVFLAWYRRQSNDTKDIIRTLGAGLLLIGAADVIANKL